MNPPEHKSTATATVDEHAQSLDHTDLSVFYNKEHVVLLGEQYKEQTTVTLDQMKADVDVFGAACFGGIANKDSRTLEITVSSGASKIIRKDKKSDCEVRVLSEAGRIKVGIANAGSIVVHVKAYM